MIAAQRALVLAATSDRGDLGTLGRAAAGLGIDVSALERAEGAGLITLRPGSVEFRHPLARSAVYANAPPEQRREAHRALATALPDRDVDRRAWHLAGAAVGLDDSASAALEQTGVRGYDRSAYATASAAFERAAQLAVESRRRVRLLLRAAEAALAGGPGGESDRAARPNPRHRHRPRHSRRDRPPRRAHRDAYAGR